MIKLTYWIKWKEKSGSVCNDIDYNMKLDTRNILKFSVLTLMIVRINLYLILHSTISPLSCTGGHDCNCDGHFYTLQREHSWPNIYCFLSMSTWVSAQASCACTLEKYSEAGFSWPCQQHEVSGHWKDLDLSILHIFVKMMITNRNVLGVWTQLGETCKLKCTWIILKKPCSVYKVHYKVKKIVFCYILHKFHSWDDITMRA